MFILFDNHRELHLRPCGKLPCEGLCQNANVFRFARKGVVKPRRESQCREHQQENCGDADCRDETFLAFLDEFDLHGMHEVNSLRGRTLNQDPQ